MPPKGRRKTVPVQQRAALRAYDLAALAKGQELSGNDLIAWFQDQYDIKLNKTDVCRWRKDKSLDNVAIDGDDTRYRQRGEHWPQVEEALSTWVVNKQGQIPITTAVLQEKAIFFWKELHPRQSAAPSFSSGWLQNFLNRHKITSRILHGEASSVADDAKDKIAPIKDIVQQYDPKDVFNCDESSLFWRMVPDRSYSTRAIPGRKKDKSRITAHFCCNADGSERLPIWWIGVAKNPHAFRSIRAENFLIWRNNKKAWMTGTIFKEWLKWFDNRMRNRKVLLLLDNFSAHTLAATQLLEEGQLSNTRVEFLPPNTTSIYQPLDQGIIASFKSRWRKRWISFMLHEDERGRNYMDTMNVLHAIRWGNDIWDAEITNATIRNCFQKGLEVFGTQYALQEDTESEELLSDIANDYERLKSLSGIRDLMRIDNFLNPADETVADPIEDLEQHIIDSLVPTKTTPEANEDEGGSAEQEIEKITYRQAIDALRVLSLFEEQRKGGDCELIRIFNRHQHTLEAQELHERKQKPITHFFEKK